MQYTKLGNSELNVSRICMGCMGFGDARNGQHSWTVGATKLHHVEGAAKAVDLTLSDEELRYLEVPYVPHALVGVMAQNTAAAAKEKFN